MVILAHGMGGLKEWTIPEVADVLNAAGIAALAFDYRNFGDSDGQPREEVDHAGQINDWRNAVTFATTQPEIDPERIGLWGTSLGGRNVLAVGALDHRVRCIYSQVPPLGFAPEVLPMMVGASTRDEAEGVINDELHDRALGAEPKYVDFPTGPEWEHGPYWATFGEVEKRNWTPHATLQSFAPSLADDVRPLLPLISPTPVFVVAAKADSYRPLPIAPGRLRHDPRTEEADGDRRKPPRGLHHFQGRHDRHGARLVRRAPRDLGLTSPSMPHAERIASREASRTPENGSI